MYDCVVYFVSLKEEFPEYTPYCLLVMHIIDDILCINHMHDFRLPQSCRWYLRS